MAKRFLLRRLEFAFLPHALFSHPRVGKSWAAGMFCLATLLLLSACGDGEPDVEVLDTPPVTDEPIPESVSFADVSRRAGQEGCLSSGCHAGNGKDWFQSRAVIIIRGELTVRMQAGGMTTFNLPSQTLRSLVSEWSNGSFQ